MSDFKKVNDNQFHSPTLGWIEKRSVGKGRNKRYEYFVHSEQDPTRTPLLWFGPYPTSKLAEYALEKVEV